MKISQKTIRIIYDVFFTVATVVTAFLLILQTLDIYLAGIHPSHTGDIFTREIVNEKLSQIALPLILWIALALVSFVYDFMTKPKRAKVTISKTYILSSLKNKMPEVLDNALADGYRSLKSKENMVNVIKLACAVISLATIVYGIIYLAVPFHFTSASEATADMLRLVKNVFPVVFFAIALWIVALYIEENIAKNQIEYVKRLTKGQKAVKKQNAIEMFFDNPVVILSLRSGLFILATVFIIIGVINGGMYDVFVKAVNICTECIGLG